MARVTLWGMYQYDPTLFDDVQLPQGYLKDVLIDRIMREGGQLYPYHQVPPKLKTSITLWFEGRYYDFLQMFTALHSVYNPIENYDRYEDLSREYQDSGTDTTNTGGSSNSTVTPNVTNTTTTDVSAFDASTYQPRDKTVSGQTGNTQTEDEYGSKTDTLYGKKREETETNHVHGNIGVTTNQQMIESEIEMRQKYDLYGIIYGLFETEFLSQVYS